MGNLALAISAMGGITSSNVDRNNSISGVEKGSAAIFSFSHYVHKVATAKDQGQLLATTVYARVQYPSLPHR